MLKGKRSYCYGNNNDRDKCQNDILILSALLMKGDKIAHERRKKAI